METLKRFVLTGVIVLGIPFSALAVAERAVGTIEGDVLKIDSHNIVVRSHKDGNEISLPVGRETHLGRQFKPEDKVEIVVTPQGVLTSVEPLKAGLRR